MDAVTDAATKSPEGAPWLIWLAIAVVTLLLREGVAALRLLKSDARDERKIVDTRKQKERDELVIDLQTRVKSLEGLLAKSQTDHIDCVTKYERLKGSHDTQGRDIDLLRKEVDSLRQWRHDMANNEHVRVLNKDIEKI